MSTLSHSHSHSVLGVLLLNRHSLNTFLHLFFVSTNETTDALPSVAQTFRGTDTEILSSFKVTTEIVRNKLAGLKRNKAHGVDRVSTNMLMELSPVITDHLML